MPQQGRLGPRSPGGSWTLGLQHLPKLTIKGRHHFTCLLKYSACATFARWSASWAVAALVLSGIQISSRALSCCCQGHAPQGLPLSSPQTAPATPFVSPCSATVIIMLLRCSLCVLRKVGSNSVPLQSVVFSDTGAGQRAEQRTRGRFQKTTACCTVS